MGNQLQIVSIDLDEARPVVSSFAASNHAHFTIALGNKTVEKAYGIDTIPANIVIAPGGKVIYSAVGFDEADIVQATHRAAASTSHSMMRRRASATERAGVRVATNYQVKTGVAPAPSAAAGTAGPFADVPADHWAAAAVDLLHRRGIVIGYP